MSINVSAIRAVIQNARNKAQEDYGAAQQTLSNRHEQELRELQQKQALERADLDAQHASGLSWADQVLAISDPTDTAVQSPAGTVET